jgi:hypothetical protein
MSGKKLRPGDPAPSAGLYAVVDVDGTITDVAYRIKKKGTMLPPTYRPRQCFVKLDGGSNPGLKAG